MDLTAELLAPFPPASVFAWVEDLARYPDWLDIVPRAAVAPAAAGDTGPAWTVDLRGRLGPLARSKRLRMVRTEHRPGSLARFERAELDGRSHAAWMLVAEVTDDPQGSALTMHLHYGGSLWGPVLERLLGDEIQQSRTRLLECLTASRAT